MTTKPQLGQRQQPSQRSLSIANAAHRPPPHRTLSQPFSRNEAFVDLTLDGSDAATGRYGAIPRMGGSRLRLDIADTDNADFVALPQPGANSTPAWLPSGPPPTRPLLHFDVPPVTNLSPRAAQEAGRTEAAIKTMPMPTRPGHYYPQASGKTRAMVGSWSKKDTRPKPYTLEVPTAAPHYPQNGHSDFFPWTGNHPEDQLTENIIRSGYFDKAHLAQIETGSARTALLPVLKNKAALQHLSLVFTSILAQRRSYSQIKSGSTFKPPPRVTVTDTKREMWLKDLANPTISLRRLSRSIPHGIRGKVLLDQSLSKNIPIERAVWLAKCVGANELRSFRRKGINGTFAMGHEAKWIRDFTVCVEQFVESIVGTCGEGDFKGRINYAIRLATYFHAEYLLDREHYLDWLVSSLENSTWAKLPLWILVTQIYWKNILQYRKYGRRLSTALLNHFAETLNHPDQDVLAPISDRLHQLLKGLMASRPDGFVSPKSWAKHRDVIRSKLVADDQCFLVVFDVLDRRNRRLIMPEKEKELTIRQRVIRLLDTALSGSPAENLPSMCWQIDEDKTMLFGVVLGWSTSSYRPGVSKIYIAARVARYWHKSGVDITEIILDFVDSESCEKERDKPSLYHLVGELARSEHFSTARYLQWLIARGGLNDAADVALEGPCVTRMLAELPTHGLSEAIATLHSTLLGRAGFSVDDEEDMMRDCMASMDRTLPTMQADHDSDMGLAGFNATNDIPNLISRLSRSGKSEIGLWLRHKVRLQMQQPNPSRTEWDATIAKNNAFTITTQDFHTIRHYLELVEDYSMLADVLKITGNSSDADVLASCTDTLNLHLDTFAAIGAVHSLFDTLVHRLRVLADDQDSVPKSFLASLSDLAARIPGQKSAAQQLSMELALCGRNTAADACSPVSDHMALVQNSGPDFVDEVEKILASGNSMDQATLDRLFQRIVLHLESSWEKSPEQQNCCGLLLTRLRPFDVQHFDSAMSAWVTKFLQISHRPSMMHVLAPLVGSGCVSLLTISQTSESLIAKYAAHKSPLIQNLSQELMCLLVADPDDIQALSVKEAYNLRIKQSHIQKDFSGEILSSIRHALEQQAYANGKGAPSRAFDVSELLKTRRVWELLQTYALLVPESVIRVLVLPLLQSSNPRGAISALAIVNRLLLGEVSDTEVSTEAILDVADDLTLPFCQIKLESMFSGAISSTHDSRTNRLQAFNVAIEAAVSSGKTAWASIVPLLDVSVAQHLRRRAELQFLGLFPSPKHPGSYDVTSMEGRSMQAHNLLRIIDSTAYSMLSTPSANPGNPSISNEILAILNGIRLLLSNIKFFQSKDAVIAQWTPLILQFVTLHTSEFAATRPGHECKAKVILALSAILLELQAIDINTDLVNGLIEQTFDLALHLIDSLPDDVRQQCIRSLPDTVANSQMYYLYSFSAHPSQWLVVCQKEVTLSVLLSSEASASGRRIAEKFKPFPLRRWELLEEPTPNIGENDACLNLRLFGARRG